MSLDNKHWFFDATSAEERDEWVAAIGQQILSSLQVSSEGSEQPTVVLVFASTFAILH